MAIPRHHDYNRDNYPHFVVNHGNWDICADDHGHCAAIPSVSGQAAGCNATQFGDMAYVKVTLSKELAAQAKAKAEAAEVDQTTALAPA